MILFFMILSILSKLIFKSKMNKAAIFALQLLFEIILKMNMHVLRIQALKKLTCAY
jgi:hypothetical protein